MSPKKHFGVQCFNVLNVQFHSDSFSQRCSSVTLWRNNVFHSLSKIYFPSLLSFLDYLKEIYPSQLTVEKANKSDHLADYLDLTFIIDSGGKLSTRLYDKRDDFDFHTVNFPYLSSNIPSGPSYGVYISQLITYPYKI